jgi:hypothetical protein
VGLVGSAATVAGRVVAAGIIGWTGGLAGSSTVASVTGSAVGRSAAWRVVAASVVGWSSGSVGPVGPSGPSGRVGPVGAVGPVGGVEGDGGAVDVQFPAVVVEAAVVA